VEEKSEIHNSQIIVPKTPTPEKITAEAKRKEYSRANGHMSTLKATTQNPS
jgi:hypothetical protein